MSRLDHDCAMACAKTVLDMVGHLLRPEEQKEFFGMVFTAVEACLLKRDVLLARERKRLGKPSDNRGEHDEPVLGPSEVVAGAGGAGEP